jgi:hypothetical protein
MGIDNHDFRKNESDLFLLRGLENNYQVEAAGEIRSSAPTFENLRRSSETQQVSEPMIVGSSVRLGYKWKSR